jgi:uncharacterized membrane protein
MSDTDWRATSIDNKAAMALLAVGLLLFLGIHLLPTAVGARGQLISRWGEQRYKGSFSLVSLAGFVLIIIGYAYGSRGTQLFAPLPAARAIAPFAMVVSFILLAAANMRTHIRATIKHPMLIGVIIWSAVHLLANGDARGTLLFGAFLAYALIDLVSAIHRRAVKKFVPEAKQDVIAVVAGTVVALVVMSVHRWLFGVPVVRFGF